MQLRGIYITGLVLLGAASAAHAKMSLNAPNPTQYKKELAQKLNRVNVDPDVREGSFSGYKAGETNEDDLNPKLSTGTYHSFTWDYCMKWASSQRCNDWLHPYISHHGEHKDDSAPGENAVFAAYQQYKGVATATQFSIWDVKSQGNYLNTDGTLNRENLTKWSVRRELASKLQDIGSRTASQAIWRSYDQNDRNNPNVMPNMESLRRMGASFTKMMRNRFVAGIGQIRASQPGIEFNMGSSEINNCRQYMAQAQQSRNQTQGEDRLAKQNVLSIPTRVLNRRLDDRAKLCEQMLNMSVYAVNPRVYGRQIKMAGPKREWIDASLYRANIAALDFTGADPREIVDMDKRLEFADDDLKSNITQYETGGLKAKTVAMTNADQLRLYNKSLDQAAEAINRVSSRLGYAAPRGESTRDYKIAPKEMAAAMITDITPDMRLELKGTDYKQAQSAPSQSNEPGNRPEMKPSDLIVKQMQ
jgi:hypothetical protein